MSKTVAPGLHLLIDFFGGQHLTDGAFIADALTQAAASSKATLLNLDLHSFGNGAGITGVAVLAESHITIHTWPENDYIALDVFMCSSHNPYQALDSLKNSFKPQRVFYTEHKRGITAP